MNDGSGDGGSERTRKINANNKKPSPEETEISRDSNTKRQNIWIISFIFTQCCL